MKSSTVNSKQEKPVLKVIRERLGEAEGKIEPISQQEFANRLGAGLATVSRWERGVTPATLTIAQMKRLKQMLDKIGWVIEDLPDDLSAPGGKAM